MLLLHHCWAVKLTWRSYDTGTISGILGMEYFRDHFSTPGNIDSDGHGVITASQQSLIVSLLSVGTFFGV